MGNINKNAHELWVRFCITNVEFEGEREVPKQRKNKTKENNIGQTGKLRPKNYLSQNSPHGGASDEVGAVVLGLVLVHALLGLGGFGLGGHLVFDAILVRHGDLFFCARDCTGAESGDRETRVECLQRQWSHLMTNQLTWRRTDPFVMRMRLILLGQGR